MKSESVPRLGRGCRLAEDPVQGWILLIPEGVLKLSGPGPEILKHCDGVRTLGDIARELAVKFPGADATRIEGETTAFLERLEEKRIIVVE